jgi:hypothetical protein
MQMTDRDRLPHPPGPDTTDRLPGADDWREQTIPGLTPIPGGPASGAGTTAVYGGPGYGTPPFQQPQYEQPQYEQPRYEPQRSGTRRYEDVGYDRTGSTGGYGHAGAEPAATAPAYSSRPVATRRPDPVAALLLLLAGIAAAVSLVLHWLTRTQQTGWTLLRDGLQDFGAIFRTGMWQPLAIILGGGALFLIGLLVLVPARAHRLLGLLALLITLAIGAAVLVPLADADWRLSPFAIGFFFAFAVGGLGLLGSLKALLSSPRLR